MFRRVMPSIIMKVQEWLGVSAFVPAVVVILCVGCGTAGEEALPGNSKPQIAFASVSVDGVPQSYTAKSSLDIGIHAEDGVLYTYALLMNQADCNGAKYSDWVDINQTLQLALGDDGVQRLCLIILTRDDAGTETRTPVSYQWIKDTKAPKTRVESRTIAGPNIDGSSSLVVSGQIEESTSGIDKVALIVKNSDGQCLNESKTAFTPNCSTAVAAGGSGPWSISIPKSLFVDSKSYSFVGASIDKAGNKETTTEAVTMQWDSQAPAAPVSLTGSAGQESVALSWPAASDAQSYIVLARSGAAVAMSPTPGATYKEGDFLGNSTVVAYSGKNLSYTHQNLMAYVAYYYAIFSVDAAGNVSSTSAGTNALPIERTGFKGVLHAFLNAPGGRISVEWQPYDDGSTSLSSVSYNIYTATSSGGQNFSGSPAATATGTNTVNFTYSGSATDLFIAVREVRNGTADTNTREFRLRLGSGYHHKLVSTGRYVGAVASVPTSYTFLRNTYNVTFDPWDNIIFSGQNGSLLVMCQETNSASYCRARTAGRVYTIAGTDGLGDAADGVLATANPIGTVQGVATDSYGNIYIADATYFRVRAVCFDPQSPGVCNGKPRGFMYSIAGTGVAGDGSSSLLATTVAFNTPYAIAADSRGNLFLGDGPNRKLRAVCYVTSGTGHYCAGKTPGNMYLAAGTGTLADGADIQTPTAVGIGEPRGIDIDNYDNILFTDWDYRRVRAICFTVNSNGGWCSGKTSGVMYRVAGTGAAADAGDGVAASSTGLGQAYGLAVDRYGNIFYGDQQYKRLRVICIDNTAAGSCSGLTVGYNYRLAGTGAAVDGGNDVLAAISSPGDPRQIALDSRRNVFVADGQFFKIRAVCSSVATGGFCDQQTPGNLYTAIGVGTGTGGWGFVSSFQTPIGTPQGVAVDALGNIYSSDSTNFRVRVYCANTSAGVCTGKTAGKTYFIVGTGVTGDAADAVSPLLNPVGAINGVAVDASYNVYMADTTNRRIRVLCNSVTSGTCNGRNVGYLYRLAGTGAAADGADNAVASSTGIGTVTGIAVDDLYNVHFADSQYFRVRTICYATSAGFCSGKTANNIYRVAGTGASTDGADASVASTTGMGLVNALAIDSARNIWLADAGFFRVRAICHSTAAGYCSGKTAGNSYRVAGTGVTGDGAVGGTANVTATGATNGIAVDSYNNVFWTDSTNRRVRVVCNTVASGYCAGLVAGASYRVAGSAVATGDAVSNIDSTTAALDLGTSAVLSIQPSTNDFVISGATTIRFIKGWP